MSQQRSIEERLAFYLDGVPVIDLDNMKILEKSVEFSEFWKHVQINRTELTAAILEFAWQERRLVALDIKHQIESAGKDHSSIRRPLKEHIIQNYLEATA